MSLHFRILGDPKPKQSARHSANSGVIRSWQPKEVVNATAHIKQQVIQQLPKDFEIYDGVPLNVVITFTFVKPKSIKKNVVEKITKPDLDNLQKLLLDAMQGIVYTNDAHIIALQSYKIFGDTPLTFVSIYERPLTNDNLGQIKDNSTSER